MLKNFYSIKTLNYLKIYLSIFIIILLLLFASCNEEHPTADSNNSGSIKAKIAVFSDPHLLDPALGTNLADNPEILGYTNKMITASEAILLSAIDEIILEDVDLLFIPGDLTKDGELQSHQKFAQHLKTLENSGVKVYVVPGNHDIFNARAKSYNSPEPTPTENISHSQFAQIYNDFGYEEALFREPNSLSYVAEPVEGLWLIGIDCCDYDNNIANHTSVTSGRIKPETYEWIKSKIAEGINSNKTVFGIMHHGATEHFIGQTQFFPQYVVKDFQKVRSEFASLGMKIVFTGHYHAQDIVKFENGGDFIFDIETGSLVTWPSPFRIMELTNDNYLNIFSRRITSIDFDTGGLSFDEYARRAVEEGLPNIIESYLVDFFSVPQSDAQIASPLMTKSIMAHYAGDEEISQETLNEIQALASSENPTMQQIAAGLNLLWLDPIPQDNDIKIDLNTGTTQ